jgi:hypothetical protein
MQKRGNVLSARFQVVLLTMRKVEQLLKINAAVNCLDEEA